jgi:glycerophosphoryl diester phosphodiesterase
MIVVGHRGWLQKYPENTLTGFSAAIALGVDAIELDVYLTKDDRLVVIHDQDTDRTTGVPGSVRDMTLDEIRRLDAGRWFSSEFTGERIPTLDEVMELAAGKVALAVEVKPPGGTSGRLCEKLIPLVKSYPDDVVVHSFDANFLREFHALCGDVDTGLLCMATSGTVALAKEIGCTAFHPAWQTLTHELNVAARRAGLNIMVWTARSEEDCHAILDRLDVDAIGADCPDVLLKILRNEGER